MRYWRYFLKTLSVNYFSENTHTHWDRQTLGHVTETQIQTIVENWEGIITTAIWYWQKLFGIQNGESSLAKTVSPYPWNVSLEINGWSDDSVDAQKRWPRQRWPLVDFYLRSARQACAGLHTATKVSHSKASLQVIPMQHSPLSYTCLIRALKKVGIQISMEKAKTIQAELLIILLSIKYLSRVNSMCQSSMIDARKQK